jgi:dephospho-CoA kinase
MIVLGLTGSIGMGKSTTASMFREENIPVYDADAAVHALYEGEAVAIVEKLFPGTTRQGRVDRAKLADEVIDNPAALKQLEAAIHPLVRKREQRFLAEASEKGADLVVLDIPLLFETGGEKRVDGVIVVTASAQEQRKRVLARPDMTEQKFKRILARQTPDEEKRRRADFIVDSGYGFEAARQSVKEIIADIRSGRWSRSKSRQSTDSAASESSGNNGAAGER